MRARVRRTATAVAMTAAMMATVPGAEAADVTVRVDPAAVSGGEIPGHFVGVSIEWALIDRYMGPPARPRFAKLLRNLRSRGLRVGGSSQGQGRFLATPRARGP